MSEEAKKRTRKAKKELFNKIDTVIDKLIEAQKLQENLEERAASKLIEEVIESCQEIAESIETLSEDIEEDLPQKKHNRYPPQNLADRQQFKKAILQAISTARKRSLSHTLCYLYLDRFNYFVAIHGWDAGEKLLKQLTAILQEHTRPGDTIAYLEEDEFAILLDRCPITEAEKIAATLRKIVESFRFNHHGRSLGITLNIGLATIDDRTQDCNTVFDAAEIACYRAKKKATTVSKYSNKLDRR